MRVLFFVPPCLCGKFYKKQLRLAAAHRSVDIALHVFFLERFSLVKLFFATADAHENFGSAPFEVHL